MMVKKRILARSEPGDKRTKPAKPDKPYPDFPLFPHNNGQWAKKIRGKVFYFGLWEDPQAALEEYVQERDDLHAGRKPRANPDGLTVRSLLNRFLTAKQHLLDTGEITPRSFQDYKATCKRVGKQFGLSRLVDDLRVSDFEQLRASMAKTWGPSTIGNEVQRVRVLFKYAYDAELIEKPIRFGPHFKRPSRRVMRKVRADKGPKMFEADELRRLLDAAEQPLRAMIYLGINCGFGNHDCGTLPRRAVDLEAGWIDYPRPKTGIQRRCPLWKETVAALREALESRPTPKSRADAGLFFITKYGNGWSKDSTDKPISKEMTKLVKDLDLHRTGLGFYALRHTFETIGGESQDQVAVDAIMGHARDDMASLYRERISDKRLEAVTRHIHRWLFPPKKKAKRRARKTE
jgi:integrase